MASTKRRVIVSKTKFVEFFFRRFKKFDHNFGTEKNVFDIDKVFLETNSFPDE